MGMAVNEKKNFTIEPEEAYGYRDESLTHAFARSEVPAEMDVKVGQTIALSSPEGQQVPAQIVEADDQKVVVDLNHPLAGKTLTFDIEVVDINSSPAQQPVGCGTGCHCVSDSD
jgi:peptidylprolyl isomerase